MKKTSLNSKCVFLTLSLVVFVVGASADPAQNSGTSPSGLSVEGLEDLDDAGKLRILRLLDSLQAPFTGLKGEEWRRRKGAYLVALTDTSGGVLLCRIDSSEIREIANIPTSLDANLAGEWNEDGASDRMMPSESAVILVTGKKPQGISIG